MPGFGPAAEALLFRQKDPKPLTPRPVSLNGTDANFRRAGQLGALTQGPPIHESVHPWVWTAGVSQQRKRRADNKVLAIIWNIHNGSYRACRIVLSPAAGLANWYFNALTRAR